ncbi:hypothetical protein GWG65_14335 [Bradyrhizobium sp. CSA207]|nr:hypothetical protein [Bradyrhizobium sp. CSA207]
MQPARVLAFAARFAGGCFNTRHCEEPLRRSNPDCLRGMILDCFAALAMASPLNRLSQPSPRNDGGDSGNSFSLLTNLFANI